MFANHSLLSDTEPSTGWFVRNDWYRSVFYAIEPNLAASGTPPRSCGAAASPPSPCLSVANIAPAGGEQRAILLLAGRSLTNASRPSAADTDYIESAENRDGDRNFEQLRVGANSNDRLIVVDANP